MPYGTVNADKMTTSDGVSSSGLYGFKNRILNGQMVIDQRNAGASVTAGATDAYTLDRWKYGASQASKFTVQQNAGSVTPPVGFTNYLGITSSSAYSVVASDFFRMVQQIEGFNVADLAWGTANAQTVTLSFWVRSSLTGTFGGSLMNSAGNRSYPFTYTISSANTWTSINVTVAGDTSGTWLTTNGAGIIVQFGLGVGSTYSGTAGSWAGALYVSATGATSVVGTNGATFYITGVQLEKGSTATSFDYRPYGTELQLCQRYYWQTVANSTAGNAYNSIAIGTGTGGTNSFMCMNHPVWMRSAATVTQSGCQVWDGSSNLSVTSVGAVYSSSTNTGVYLNHTGGSFTAGKAITLSPWGSTTAYIALSSEL